MKKLTILTILALLTAATAMAALTVPVIPAQAAAKKYAYSAPLTWRADGAGQFKFDGAVTLTNAQIASDGSVTTDSATAGSSQGTCELTTPYQADGVVDYISANWTFAGAVTMEVTATGSPKDYTAITNGALIDSSMFLPGSKLKWRATLAAGSSLTEVRIAYKDLSGASGTFGSPDLSGFTKRIQIVILRSEATKDLKDSSAASQPQNDSSGSQSLFNYQMPIRVGESEKAAGCDVYLHSATQSDFTDVRFTQADGETSLPYYRERVSGSAGQRVALFWVKIPEIPKDASLPIYVYYNANKAPDLSNPNKVFDFYEDFGGAGLDTKTWNITLLDKMGQANVSGSMLSLDSARATTVKNVFAGGILEYRAKAAANGAIIGIIAAGATPADDLATYSSITANQAHCIMQGDKVIANDPKMIAPDTFYDFRVIIDSRLRGNDIGGSNGGGSSDSGGGVTFQRFADGAGSSSADKPQAETKCSTVILSEAKNLKDSSAASQPQNDMGPSALRMTSVGLSVGLGGTGLYCDWIRARQYALVPPQVDAIKTAAATEETVDLPVFSNLTLAPDGSVILDPAAKSDGVYTSALIKAPFQVRIITEKIGTDTIFPENDSRKMVSVPIFSTDGGRTYTAGWQNGVARYASAASSLGGTSDSFAKGNQIRFKTVIGKNGTAPFLPGDDSSKKGAVPIFSSFTLTLSPGAIKVLMPVGGEAMKPGTQYGIFWETKGYDADYAFDVSYSTDGGANFLPIVSHPVILSEAKDLKDSSAASRSQNDMGSGSTYTWTIPQVESDKVMLMIADPADKSVYGISANYFTISERAGEGTITASPAVATPANPPTPIIPSEASPVILSPEGAKDLKDSSAASRPQNDKVIYPAGLYELLIKVDDPKAKKSKFPPKAGSYKEGDIVMIKPAGYIWGASERKKFAIVRMYLSSKDAQDLMAPKESAVGIGDKSGAVNQITAKRKFSLDLSKKALVESKVAARMGIALADKPVAKRSEVVEK